MLQPFKVICSDLAAKSLAQTECHDIVQVAIEQAEQRDRGVHEGLTFGFEMHTQEWKCVVDLRERWAKIMGKDEFEKALTDAVQAN